MKTTRWGKAYKGPFTKKEALAVVRDIRASANPDINGIYDARIRALRKTKSQCVCTAACGAGLGHNERYDVYIRSVR